MNQSEREDTVVYKVVVNHEEQYSIWPAERENAPGWKDAGKSGSKAECLAYIQEVWTDMWPLSLRKQMEGTWRDRGQPRTRRTYQMAESHSTAKLDQQGRFVMTTFTHWRTPSTHITLSCDEVHVWCASLDQPPWCVSGLLQTLSTDERMRAEYLFQHLVLCPFSS